MLYLKCLFEARFERKTMASSTAGTIAPQGMKS